jgi:hypothetical protein
MGSVVSDLILCSGLLGSPGIFCRNQGGPLPQILVPALVADAINISISVFIILWILKSGLFDNSQPLPWVTGRKEKEKK